MFQGLNVRKEGRALLSSVELNLHLCGSSAEFPLTSSNGSAKFKLQICFATSRLTSVFFDRCKHLMEKKNKLCYCSSFLTTGCSLSLTKVLFIISGPDARGMSVCQNTPLRHAVSRSDINQRLTSCLSQSNLPNAVRNKQSREGKSLTTKKQHPGSFLALQ